MRRTIAKNRLRASRGSILVAALVAVAIVMAILGGLLQNALRVRRQMHAERDLRQCELLLHAGAQRAAYRLAEDANYRGETWKLSAAGIVGRGEGQVTIEPVDSEGSSQFRVVAEYPLGGERSIRRSQTIHLSSPTTLQE